MKRIAQIIARIAIVVVTLVGPLAQADDSSNEAKDFSSCGFEGHIQRMAFEIVDYRANLKGFSSRQFGSDAVYFLLHYSDPSIEEERALIGLLSSDGRMARGGSSLKAAHEISQLTTSVDFVLERSEILNQFIAGDKHVLRAVLLGDAGDSYFKILSKIRIDPALNAGLEGSISTHRRIVPRLLMDQSDAVRIGVAEQALLVNENVIAARIFASLDDLSRYNELINQYTEDSEFISQAGPVAVTSYGATLQNHSTPIPAVREKSPQIARAFYNLYRASYLSVQFDLLYFFLNSGSGHQSVVNKQAEQAAEHYLAQLAAGKVVPAHDAEAYWFALYDALLMFMDRDVVHQILSRYAVSHRHRHFSGNALQLMDWVVAKRALSPFLGNKTDVLPERPTKLSDNFHWELWTEVAMDVRKRRVDYASASEAKIALELYALMHEHDAVIDIIERNFELQAQLTIYREFMQRFDRRCKNVSDFPGRAVFMQGEILYRFR